MFTENLDIKVTDNNIHITDSYQVSKYLFEDVLNDIHNDYPNNPVLENRSMFSLKMEWATHNACYNMHILRNHTKDVDLDYPQSWFMTAAYCVCGLITWPFLN